MDLTRPTDVTEASPRELADRLSRGEAITLLDVREDSERAYCRIAAPERVGDLHVPLSTIPQALEALRQTSAGGPLVIYCHHGVRSRMAADWLRSQGLSGLTNLTGGIDAWSTQVDPSVPRY